MRADEGRFYRRAFWGLLLVHCGAWFTLGMVLDLHPDTAGPLGLVPHLFLGVL